MEYKEMGHAEPVPLEFVQTRGRSMLLPVHGVVMLLSPLLISCVWCSRRLPLERLSMRVTNLYPMLTNIVLALRMHHIEMSADISEVFRQIGLHSENRDLRYEDDD